MATIAEAALIAKILSHLGLAMELPQLAPARPLAWLPGLAPQDGLDT